jgi:hypothetical protein
MTLLSVLDRVTGKIVDLDANSNANVGDVADIVAQQLGVPKGNHTLSWRGRSLGRHQTLDETGVTEGTELLFMPVTEETAIESTEWHFPALRKRAMRVVIACALIILTVLASVIVFNSYRRSAPQPVFDFNLILDPHGQYRNHAVYLYPAGQSVAVTISVALLSGNPVPVMLSTQSLPEPVASVAFSVTRASPPFDTILTIYIKNYPKATPPYGTYYLTVVADGGGITRTVSFTIVVQRIP